MARVVMDSGAMGHIEFAASDFLDDRLGPLIEEDARRYAPKRTSLMADSIFHYVEGLSLYIVSPAYYSAWVEEGHFVFHPSTGVTGPEWVDAEPFLRPALYKVRTPADPEGMPPGPTRGVKPGVTYPTLRAWEQLKMHWVFPQWARFRGRRP